jgi:hypothetical protein
VSDFRRFFLFSTRFNGQTLTALCALTRKNFAAAFGGHALAETMSLLTPTTARLIRTLHLLYSVEFLDLTRQYAHVEKASQVDRSISEFQF